MFQKLKDTLHSLNLQKLQRDAHIELSRAKYRASRLHRDLRTELHRQLNNPKLRSTWQQAQSYRPTIDPKAFSRQEFARKLNSADSRWTTVRDTVVDGIDSGLRAIGRAVRKAVRMVDVPKAVKGTVNAGKTLWGETRGLAEHNYRLSREHVKAYFRNNRRFFEYYRKKLFEIPPQTKRKIAIFAAIGVFLYGIGNALPGAVLRYQLEQQRIQRERAILTPIQTEQTADRRMRGGEEYVPAGRDYEGRGEDFEDKYK